MPRPVVERLGRADVVLVPIRDRDLVTAVAVTGCSAHSTSQPSTAPAPPVTLAAAPQPPGHPPAPVLADGRYDGYIRTVDTSRQRLVVDLLPGDCIESRNHQLAKLLTDSRAISNSRPAYHFTLTVAGGAVHQIKEDKTFNAC